MIKDALEVTRNLHRLIITASLVTIVFSLSLHFPDKTRLHREAISQYLRADFSQYDRYIESQADEAAKQLLRPVAELIRQNLDASNHLVFGLADIVSAFQKPILLGQFKVSESKLTTPSDLTVQQLEVLADSCPLTGDVRMVVVEATNVLPRLHEQLATRGKVGMRAQSLKLETSQFYPATAPPADGDQIKMLLSFELMPNGGPPSQIIDAVFDATVRRLQNTSFRRWLEQHPELGRVAQPSSNGVSWLPALADLPREMRERRLGDVLGALNEDLKKGSPESKSVSLLGTEIPGILLMYATPMTLVALCYYFFFHLTHLGQFASQHKVELVRFAWLPLSLEMEWAWEALCSLVVLPVLSLVVLGVQLGRFHFLDFGPGLFMAVAAIFIVWISCHSVSQIGKVRGQIGKPAKIRLWAKNQK